MYPNDNQQINPVDYLDQIAPKTPKKMDFLKKKPVVIGVIVLLVFMVIMIIAAIAGSVSSGTEPLKNLGIRLEGTKEIVDLAQPNIRSTKLRALNSNLSLYLTNATLDYGPIAKAYEIDIKKISDNTMLAESNSKTLDKLEDARLNAEYDLTYAREMTYKLDTVLLLMRQINKATKDKDLKIFLGDGIKNLEPIQKQFSEYNTANN